MCVFSSHVVRDIDAQIPADAMRPLPVSRSKCLNFHQTINHPIIAPISASAAAKGLSPQNGVRISTPQENHAIRSCCLSNALAYQ